jgi:glutamate--cysteine ligase
MRFLDVFLLHCLLTDSPPDTPEEIAAMARNQNRVAERGREPGLQLERNGAMVGLTDWARDVLRAAAPIAQRLNAVHGSQDYSGALLAAQHALQHPDTLPSARVLREVREKFDNCFVAFVRAHSLQTKSAMLQEPLSADALAHFSTQSQASLQEQRTVEAADTMLFEHYLGKYLAPQRLNT